MHTSMWEISVKFEKFLIAEIFGARKLAYEQSEKR